MNGKTGRIAPLNLKLYSLYNSSRTAGFDESGVVAKIFCLAYDKGYTVKNRVAEISNLLHQIPVNGLTAGERKSLESMFDTVSSDIVRYKGWVKDYANVQEQINVLKAEVSEETFYRPFRSAENNKPLITLEMPEKIPVLAAKLHTENAEPIKVNFLHTRTLPEKKKYSLSGLSRGIKNAFYGLTGTAAILMVCGGLSYFTTGCSNNSEAKENGTIQMEKKSSGEISQGNLGNLLAENMVLKKQVNIFSNLLHKTEEIVRAYSNSVHDINIALDRSNKNNTSLEETLTLYRTLDANWQIGKYTAGLTAASINANQSTNNLSATNILISNIKSNHNSGSTFGRDLDNYRIYSLKEGSRESLESIKKSGSSAKNAGNSLASALTFSYGNEKFKDLRKDDFNFRKPAKVFGKSFVNFFRRLGGPVSDKDAYKGLNAATGTVTYFGRLFGGAAGIGKNAANLATAGLGNNIIEPVLRTGEDVLETVKHGGESGLNLTRWTLKPLPAKNEEAGNKVVDCLTLVPLEFSSNVIEGEGFSNTENTQEAVKRKGSTGVMAEFLGSSALLKFSISESLEKNPSQNSNSGGRVDGPGVR